MAGTRLAGLARQTPDLPVHVTREEDEDDAYFAPGAAKAPFRLGHKMDALELAGEDVDRGVMVRVREKGQVGYVLLADVEVTRANLRCNTLDARGCVLRHQAQGSALGPPPPRWPGLTSRWLRLRFPSD